MNMDVHDSIAKQCRVCANITSKKFDCTEYEKDLRDVFSITQKENDPHFFCFKCYMHIKNVQSIDTSGNVYLNKRLWSPHQPNCSICKILIKQRKGGPKNLLHRSSMTKVSTYILTIHNLEPCDNVNNFSCGGSAQMIQPCDYMLSCGHFQCRNCPCSCAGQHFLFKCLAARNTYEVPEFIMVF